MVSRIMLGQKRPKRKWELSGMHKDAYKFLRVNGITPVKELASSLGVSYRQCMDVLSELTMVYSVPVGACRDIEKPFGVYIATNKEEALEGTAQLYSQYLKTKKRVETVRNADFSILDVYDEQCEIG